MYVPEMEKTQAELEYEAELQKSEELRKIYLEQKENIRQLRVGLSFCESLIKLDTLTVIQEEYRRLAADAAADGEDGNADAA